MKKLLPCALLLVLVCACDKRKSTAPEESRQVAYESAIEDAVFADSAEICRRLVAIVPGNRGTVWSSGGGRVLVLTWTRYPSSFPAADTITTSWGGSDEIGMSEFVLRKGSSAIVETTCTNGEFYLAEVAR